MAEAVVGVLISKLGEALANQATACGPSLLCKEASALKGLFGEIRKAKEELESMKAYLDESEKFKDTDETTGIFINKIRELSFQIEDVIDEFIRSALHNFPVIVSASVVVLLFLRQDYSQQNWWPLVFS